MTAPRSVIRRTCRAAAVRLRRNFLARASVAELRDNFAAGTDVTITFLPGDHYRHNIETATALRRAGFNPVPHIAAREMPSREALDDFLARARGEADVTRILLIAGDVAAAKGPFKSTPRRLRQRIDRGARHRVRQRGRSSRGPPVSRTGRRAEGARGVARLGTADTTRVDVVTQFCFESGPILQWIGELDHAGIGLPVIVGLAGPATPATLTKFALRCGIGNSMRALRSQIGRFGRLLTDNGPDDVVRGLRCAPAAATAAIAGFHLFPFGGLRKAGDWLRNYDRDPLRQAERAAISRAGPQNP